MIRNQTLHLLPLTVLLLSGCHSASLVPRLVDRADLGLSIERVRTDRVWRPSEPGRGLQITIWTNRDIADYERNLTLELDGAARVCSTLASSDELEKWSYINVLFFITFRNPPESTRNVVGVAEVIIRREVLRALGAREAPASEYPTRWRFVSGYKDQPDSKELLRW